MAKQSNLNHIPPAQLWIGSEDILLDATIQYLQAQFCAKNACKICTQCMQIRQNNFYNIMWLTPEKHYTQAEIQPIFEKITLSLSLNEKYFFVLQKADFMSPSCANSLLKCIEEPPSGYHFIFLAQTKETILPTIQSRCVLKNFKNEAQDTPYEELFNFFTGLKQPKDFDFLQTIGKSTINERESIELVNLLFLTWHKKLKTTLIKEKESSEIEVKLKALTDALDQPPMPGSVKIFWKNLYLQMYK
ncbi:MAG: polymerase III, delta prime subunit protein [candidate division TM6 bacterium GW2011_GWF2_32_72]|nr:MAG: polymerase III, delta prime subunit protein [candidate division TM6 bacterium GW2011_GWF2_32_72]